MMRAWRFERQLERFRALMFALSLTLFSAATQAQQPSTRVNPQATSSPSPTPLSQDSTGPRRIHAIRTADTIKIDGTLDEPSWSLARPATDFLQQQPDEGAPASERTEVRVLFDDKNIYFGIRAFDSNAKHINARELVRDADFSNDDTVAILLDTYHDRRNGFRFMVNPLGTQQDALITDEGRDINITWNGSWISAGRIDDKGFTVEIEIPLTTLRFKEGIEAWGLNVSRIIRRKNEENLWTSWQRSFGLERVSQAGELAGVEEIRRRRLREGNFSTSLFSGRLNYNFSRKLLTSALIQLNSAARLSVINVRLRYIYRPNSDFFIIYNQSTGAGLERPSYGLQIKLTRDFTF